MNQHSHTYFSILPVVVPRTNRDAVAEVIGKRNDRIIDDDCSFLRIIGSLRFYQISPQPVQVLDVQISDLCAVLAIQTVLYGLLLRVQEIQHPIRILALRCCEYDDVAELRTVLEKLSSVGTNARVDRVLLAI